MRLAVVPSPSGTSIVTETLAWPPLADLPIEDDFRVIRESELVVFQKKEAVSPPFTNRRFLEYEQYVRQQAVEAPSKVTDDISIYRIHHDRRGEQRP